jgi:hypothetical protein
VLAAITWVGGAIYAQALATKVSYWASPTPGS